MKASFTIGLLALAVLLVTACSIDNTIEGYMGIQSASGSGISVKILRPQDQEVLTSKSFAEIAVEVTDATLVQSVEFLIKDGVRCDVYAPPFECRWRVPATESREYKIDVYVRTVYQEVYHETLTVYSGMNE